MSLFDELRRHVELPFDQARMLPLAAYESEELLQREIADLQVQRQKGQYLPDIRLEGTVVRRRAEFPSNTLGSISVNANWTLFDGFRRSAQVAEARSQLREVELRRALLQFPLRRSQQFRPPFE